MGWGEGVVIEDGDTVVLTQPCRVDGYWFDPGYMNRGCWDLAYLLPGLKGTVIKAKTPCVLYNPKNQPSFFANVDVEYLGKTYRVREFHDHFEKVKS